MCKWYIRTMVVDLYNDGTINKLTHAPLHTLHITNIGNKNNLYITFSQVSYVLANTMQYETNGTISHTEHNSHTDQ